MHVKSTEFAQSIQQTSWRKIQIKMDFVNVISLMHFHPLLPKKSDFQKLASIKKLFAINFAHFLMFEFLLILNIFILLSHTPATMMTGKIFSLAIFAQLKNVNNLSALAVAVVDGGLCMWRQKAFKTFGANFFPLLILNRNAVTLQFVKCTRTRFLYAINFFFYYAAKLSRHRFGAQRSEYGRIKKEFLLLLI